MGDPMLLLCHVTNCSLRCGLHTGSVATVVAVESVVQSLGWHRRSDGSLLPLMQVTVLCDAITE